MSRFNHEISADTYQVTYHGSKQVGDTYTHSVFGKGVIIRRQGNLIWVRKTTD